MTRTRALVLWLTAAVALIAPAGAAAEAHRIGDIAVWAHVPYPGNPGGIAVSGDAVWVDSSAANLDRPFDAASALFAYGLGDHRLQPRRPNPVTVPERSVDTMGLAGIALDADGRQYIADMNGRVVRFDPRTQKVEDYATFPTSTWTSFTSMPTFDAFGPDGSLYVGDAGGQPVIWRVPPGGGQAEPWFVDPRLAGTWGATVLGLAVDPTGRDLYFAVGNQRPQITVYRLPLAAPDPANLEEFHAYDDVVSPPCAPSAIDHNTTPAVLTCEITQRLGASGIAFGRSGRLYVAFLSKNQISILDPDGREAARFPSTEENAKLPVPLDGPFGLAFDGRGSLLITNVGNPTAGYLPGHTPPPGGLDDSDSWAVLSAWVNDRAGRLFRPHITMTAAARAEVRAGLARLGTAPPAAVCFLAAVAGGR